MIEAPEGAVVLDGLGEAIIGQTTGGLLVYSCDKIIQIHMERDDMDFETALEYFSHNIECLRVGDGTPVLIWEW